MPILHRPIRCLSSLGLSAFCLITLAGGLASAAAQPPAAPTTDPAAKQPPEAAEALPAPKEILAKYIKAIGGEEAIRKHTSRKDSGKMVIGDKSGTMVVYSAAPNKRAAVFSAPEGEMRQGYNGQKGWEMSPQGARFIEGDALNERARGSDFYQSLYFDKVYDIKVVGLEIFDGKKAYRLSFTPKADAGNPNSTSEQFMIFDAQTGLLIGRITQRQTPGGVVKLEATISDYKEFGGLQIPTKITTRFAEGQQEMTLDSVEFDSVPDTAFDIPTELQNKK